MVKILIFHHDAGPQALIQFHSAQEADEVKQALQSQTLTIDGNTISFEIQFSKFQDLRVNQNNKYSWNFIEVAVPPHHHM